MLGEDPIRDLEADDVQHALERAGPLWRLSGFQGKVGDSDLSGDLSVRLDGARLDAVIADLRSVAALPDPIGNITDVREQASGIKVGHMRVPLGVIGIIYESRPNVTADAAALCLKSGNAAILRGGSEAIRCNRAIAALGGVVRTEVGTATTWIDVRVPAARWQDAEAALFAALTAQPRPASAYDIAEHVSKERGKRVAANSVYRILDLFVASNLARRVESANAYVANPHPGCRHDCIFLICDSCGQATHIDDDRLTGALVEAELGRPLPEVFSSWQDSPIGSGSAVP